MPLTPRQESDEATRLDRMAQSWRDHLSKAPQAALQLLAALPGPVVADLANDFYRALLDDPRASRFLSYDDVWTRLKPALERWLHAVLKAKSDDAMELTQLNHRAGSLHARIDLPVDLMTQGFRILRHRLAEALRREEPDPALAYSALCVAGESMDLGLEGMSAAYVSGSERSARSDATYRLFSLMRNAGTERERQRAMLLDWENSLLYMMASGGDISSISTLTETEFGRWFIHKGAPSFGDHEAVVTVQRAMLAIDALLWRLPDAGSDRMHLLEAIRDHLSNIRQSLTVLFEQVSELDSGTDALTALLNRRFLPSVLRREILLSDRSGDRFALLLLDIDHFKTINDRFGHAAGDAALRHVADLLGRLTRGSDYLFRLGGEEFLVVLVDCEEARASMIADQICRQLSATPMDWSGVDQGITVTASIGVAAYDGHPDYEYLMRRTDAAMYQAKQAGRNQVCVSRISPTTD